MSGGYVNEKGLAAGEHQVVMFTFKGVIPKAKCIQWNIAIRALKASFGNQAIGATFDANPTPGPMAFAPGGGTNVMGVPLSARAKKPGRKAFGAKKKAKKKAAGSGTRGGR